MLENNHQSDSFHHILQRSLKSDFNHRPPILEFSGVLTPCYVAKNGMHFQYKLTIDQDQFILSLSSRLLAVAKKMEWEEVTVRGVLDLATKVIEVRMMNLIEPREFRNEIGQAISLNSSLDEISWTLRNHGFLEPDQDGIAS